MSNIHVIYNGKNILTKSNKINRTLKLSIRKEYLRKLSEIIPECAITIDLRKRLREDTEYVEIRTRKFYEMIDTIEKRCQKVALHSHIYYSNKTGDSIEDDYIEAFNQYKNTDFSVDYIRESVLNNDFTLCEKYIEIMYNLITTSSILYRVRDLLLIKEELFESLKYIVQEEKAKEYLNKYNELLIQRPINLTFVEKFLKELQQIILNDWKQKVTNTYKPGQPFKFIGHSMCSPYFNGKFITELISCSLFSEEFTDTYRAGYGFVFLPESIVGASDNDLYINNTAINDEECVLGTTVPTILSVDHILKNLRTRKQQNKKDKVISKIYSEVVLRGFNPCGIFCFTDGSKRLNANYVSATILQDRLPHLPIIDIDLTLYKSYEEQFELRKNLIAKIESTLNYSFNVTDKWARNFDMFWNEFANLKKKGAFSKKEIINLYEKNKQLLDINIVGSNIFAYNFSISEIKHIINYNPNFRLIDIINGRATMNLLSNLYDNLSDIDDINVLEQIIPGVSLFVKLYGDVKVNDSFIDSINECNSLMEINKFLLHLSYLEKMNYKDRYLLKDINLSFIDSNNINTFYKRLLLLKKCGLIDDATPGIDLFLLLYPNISFDSELIRRIVNVKNLELCNINDIFLERLDIQTLDVDKKIESCKMQLSLLTNESKSKNELLRKNEYFHSVMTFENLYSSNLKIIYEKREEIHKYKIELHDLESSDDIKNKEEQRNYLKQKIDELYYEIEYIKRQFENYSGINFDEYYSLLVDAKEFTKTTYMSDVASDIFRLTNNIKQIQIVLNRYKEEKNKYKVLIKQSQNL